MLPSIENLEFITDKETIDPYDVFKIFWHAEWTRERKVEDIEKMLANSGLAVLIRRKKKPVAFARAITDFIFRAYIEDVIVAPKYHRRGLGTILINTMEDLLRQNGVNRIELSTNKVYFWDKIGYTIKESTTHMIKKF